MACNHSAPCLVVWIRVGDAGDYVARGSLESAAAVLAANGVKQIHRHTRYGVWAEHFTGNNYISLYWGPNPGDGSAEADRELADEEIASVNLLLRG